MQQDFLAFVFQAMNQLLGQQSSLFEAMGMALFRAFAVIVIVWFGIQSAMSSADGGGGIQWAKFTAVLLELIFCYVMLAFYTVPIPVLGVSFTHLVLDQVQTMVAMLDQTSVQGVIESLNGIDMNLPFPSAFNLFQVFRFMILELAIIVAQAVTLAVVMFGYVATAVILLLGPLFIPFKIVPQMEWMFWGWLKAFIQFAFYQLIASAYVFVFSQFLMQILGAKNSPLSASDLGYLFGPLLLAIITFVLGITLVPALTFSIFAGRAGDYVLLRWR